MVSHDQVDTRNRAAHGWPNPPRSPLAFLFEPYLLAALVFLFVMASLSFAHPTIHSVAMLGRWPALGCMAGIGVVWWIARGSSGFPTVFVLLAAFLVMATLSALYSSERWYSFQRAGSLWLLGLTTVGLWRYCQTRREIVLVTDLLWVAGTLMVIGGFIFHIGDLDTTSRYEGLYGRATGAGTFGAIFLPIALYQVRYRLRGAGQFIGWIIIGLLFLQIALAAARTALVVSSLVCLALWVDYYGKKAAIAALLFAVLVPIPFVLSSRYVEMLRTGSSRIVRAESVATFTGRRDRWMFGLEQWWVRPFLGHGLGVSRTLAGFVDPRRFHLEPGEVFNLHSDQIEVLVDLGVVGFAFFAAFWGALGHMAASFIWDRGAPLRPVAIAYVGVIAYVFIDTFMHGGFLAAGGGISSYTWSAIAILAAIARVSQWERAQPTSPTPAIRARSTANMEFEQVRPLRARLPSAKNVLLGASASGSPRYEPSDECGADHASSWRQRRPR